MKNDGITSLSERERAIQEWKYEGRVINFSLVILEELVWTFKDLGPFDGKEVSTDGTFFSLFC